MSATTSCATIVREEYQAAGSASVYYVALLDRDRRIIRRLSGECATPAEALAFRAWARRRHPAAQVVREVLLREVLA